MQSVQFPNRSINMAGNLYLPNGFKESEQYPAIVCVHPGGGVKEQTVGVYAQRLAGCGKTRSDRGGGKGFGYSKGASTG